MSKATQQDDLDLFHQAIRTGNVEDFNKYFKDKFLEKEQFGRRPVHYASRHGQIEILKLLLDKHCDIDARSSDNWRAIHYACRESHSNVAQLLIDKGCNIEESDGDLLRPIHHACRYGLLGIVESLIGKKCNIEAKDKNDWRPIHYACRNNQISITNTLLSTTCDIEACTKPDNWRPVHFACRYGHMEIIQILMKKSLDLEARTSKDWSPIHFACSFGHFNIVKILIEKGINIESSTYDEMRPIHYACSNGNVQIVQLLLDKGCDIENYNKDNWRPIHFACRYGHHQIVEMLINAGCDMEVSTFDQMRPIHFACKYNDTAKAGNNYIEIAALLIERNCEVGIQNNSNQSPLDLAIENGNKELIDLIKEKLENPNMTNGHRLISASQEGDLKKANLMIQRKCDINICDKDGMRPIHWACLKGHIEMVKLLLKHNCDIEIVDKFNRSPTSIASGSQKEELHQIFNEEISFRKLVKEMASMMNIECSARCNHKFCSISLHSKTFEKGTFIGKGKFGKVYRYQSSQTDQEFAVKYIKNNFIPKTFKNLENILLTVNNHLKYLDHARIVRFFGSFSNPDRLCIFMEFVSGCTLETKIEKEKSICCENCAHYTRQILEGLEYLHENKIIHRDIKPSNILLNNEDNVKLVDFDLSRLLVRSDGQSSSAKTVFGTAIFMAPEIFHGKKYTYSADIWSVGITITFMISGTTPYPDLPQHLVMCKIANTKRIEFSEKYFSKDLESYIVNELLNPDPNKRLSAVELLGSGIFDLISKNVIVD